MRLLLAHSLGLCFGVHDALEVARGLEHPAQITVRGQLVHNPLVARELAARGFALVDEDAPDPPATSAVLITAHGISDRQRASLAAAGKTLIDTTCPLVKKAHAAALELARVGFHVLVLGQRNHVEVRGLTGDLPSFDIIESPADIRRWPYRNLGIIAQTTSIERDARKLVELIRWYNPQAHLRFVNTICQPTRDRQHALEELLTRIDLLVVVGGRNSNNTRRLAQRARERGIPALHIEQAADLDPSQFRPDLTVGLTAGTSTLPETIAAVQQRLESFFPDAPADPPSANSLTTSPDKLGASHA